MIFYKKSIFFVFWARFAVSAVIWKSKLRLLCRTSICKDRLNRMKIVVNGKEISVQKTMSVLQAARQADIYIPTLCQVGAALEARAD